MAGEALTKRLLVAVGSRHDEVCSIGSFARAEARALATIFSGVEVLEPDAAGVYPSCKHVARPDYIFFHAPALHDRKKPWNALLSALILRRAFPKAKFISIVHEFSEAPSHWKLRQLALVRLSHGVVVNSDADFQGVRKWHRLVLRSRLGPTLYDEGLLDVVGSEALREQLQSRIHHARSLASEEFQISPARKWLLHSGLLTRGKGVEFLIQLAPHLDSEVQLILMGGLGPKARDKEFAHKTIAELRAAFGDRFTLIEAPSDDVFKRMLVASDLVVLPYDNGLSERRSSFLSSMSCGANVWTTTGKFSNNLNIEQTAVFSVDAAAWMAGDRHAIESLRLAVAKSSIDHRMKNLTWAASRGWLARVRDIQKLVTWLG